MAKRLILSQAGIAYAVKRGENIVNDQDIQMIA